ncbi:MAG TPA: NAD(P)H-dependent oxidoreductase [Trebonia sp.]
MAEHQPVAEPVPAAIGSYKHEHTRRWSQLVASFNGFVFVIPEYNHGVPAAAKNAVDYRDHERFAAIVSPVLRPMMVRGVAASPTGSARPPPQSTRSPRSPAPPPCS